MAADTPLCKQRFCNNVLHKQSTYIYLDSKGHGANMGPIWGRQDPEGPHAGPRDLAIWVAWDTTKF